MNSSVGNADAAVGVAADQSILAAMQTTFAVGGAIIDNATGNVIMAMHNNVLQPCNGSTLFLPHDPTAHGERQLVDWYYANCGPMNLPPPSQLTVVTTLDPCAMCAGALLTAGFNVGVSAIDTYAGINYDGQFDFPSLPGTVRQAAQASFGYYAIDTPVGRPYQGAMSTVFSGGVVSARNYFLTSSIFGASVDNVRNASNNSGLPPAQMTNPATLPANAPVRQALAAVYPQAFSLAFTDPRMPDSRLAGPLQAAAQQAQSRGAAYNAVALLDPFGNLLLCLGGYENLSPIRTAFMETTRNYAELRWQLMNDPDPDTRAQAAASLTHAKYGTFVFMTMPDPGTSVAVMTLGAYGSTMEGAIPQTYPSNLQYVQPASGTTNQAVAELATQLPPFYTQSVQVAPMQVLNAQLIAQIQQAGMP